MAITAGSRLGAYEVVAHIGAGGMGHVYRARDTKLNRDVALKLLPESFAGDAERVARFAREAQTLAALNHPHIAAIYGLEESSALSALVMELVEGDDLSERIARGPIPLDEALPIAKQIAEALEAAHGQGIIHRDLKPANIKVRVDGTVKVLDFGLAKAVDPTGGSSPGLSMSPTITTPAMTAMGMILGTAAYMSPEQARGRPVDKRADVWAFGVVLYEMLSGTRAFAGEDVTELIASVMKTTPNWSALPPNLPTALVTLIQGCLEKDPKARIGDIAVARFLLANPASGSTVSTAPSLAPRVAASWTRALPWTVASTFAVAALALLILRAPWRGEKAADRPLLRLDVDLGADVSLPPPTAAGSSIAISPDGTRLLYASGTPAKLFIRRLDQPKAIELPGTQGASAPMFSPDGQWVGFVSGLKTNKISTEGGAIVPLGRSADILRASWGEDGSIFQWTLQKMLRTPPGGGPAETVGELRGSELSLNSPETLPGRNAVLLAADNPGAVDKTTIDLVTLANRQRKTIIQGGASPRYLATSNETGHLIYVSGATLFAIPFDPRTATTRGTAVPVVEDVAHDITVGVGQFDVSRTGTLVYRKAVAGTSALMTFQWVDATGKSGALPAKPGAYQDLSVSPDGKRLAFSVIDIDGVNQDIWVYDLQRDAMTRLTFGGAVNRYSCWSPDGRIIVFSSVGNGIFQVRADGASQPQPLTQSKSVQSPWMFSPDGTRLAYFQLAGTRQIWTVPIQDQGGQLKAGTPQPFVKSSFNDMAPTFSPDGRWLAYQSNESGTNEVYVRAFPTPASGQGGRWQISNNGGTAPRWARIGHELLYQSDDQLMAAKYTVNGDTFVAEKPRLWAAKLGAAIFQLGATWDLAPDGKRVVILTPVESVNASKEHEVVFLLNFFDELRRRVPLERRE